MYIISIFEDTFTYLHFTKCKKNFMCESKTCLVMPTTFITTTGKETANNHNIGGIFFCTLLKTLSGIWERNRVSGCVFPTDARCHAHNDSFSVGLIKHGFIIPHGTINCTSLMKYTTITVFVNCNAYKWMFLQVIIYPLKKWEFCYTCNTHFPYQCFFYLGVYWPYLPFLWFEFWFGIPGYEKQCPHRVHIAQSWNKKKKKRI